MIFYLFFIKKRLQIWTQLDNEPGGFRSRRMADTPSCVSNLIYDHNSVSHEVESLKLWQKDDQIHCLIQFLLSELSVISYCLH